MLAAGGRLQVVGILGSVLKAAHEALRICAGDMRALARALQVAAPPVRKSAAVEWVSKDAAGQMVAALPHLGSRARFTTGAQKLESAGERSVSETRKCTRSRVGHMHSQPSPSFITARASRPIWRPVSSHSVLLNDCASVIGNANFVVLHAPQCAHATPEVASVYQL